MSIDPDKKPSAPLVFGDKVIDTDALMEQLMSEANAGLAAAVARSEARNAAGERGGPLPHQIDPDWPQVHAARVALLDTKAWKTMTHSQREELCRQARCMPHHPDVMRFEMVREMFPHGMLIEGTPEWQRYRTLAAAKSRALKGMSEDWLTYYRLCTLARTHAGWGGAGDRAVWAVELPNQQAVETTVDEHVAAGTLMVDPNPGDRSKEAVALRKKIRTTNMAIKRRREELARFVGVADKRTDSRAVALLEQAIMKSQPEDSATVQHDLFRARCAARYEKPYAMRCVEDIETMLRLGRPIPRAARHPAGSELRWRIPHWPHSDRGRI